ncbi:SRPBCC family protein [Thermomonospora catenispora]|nr:SRPBCC family protein [Thermomonospora catenispora]
MIGGMEREWVAEESLVVAADPLRVYEAVADLRRMGRWSPECFAVWVLGRSKGRAEPGTAFVGFNRIRWRVWFTTGRVTAAVPGEAFAFRVSSLGVPVAVWGYRMEGIGEGRTRLTEYWEDLRREGRGAALVSLLGRVFTGVPAERRAAHNRRGMRITLERIKAAVEAG